MKKLICTICSVILISSSLFASGFQINEHGAKAMAMAGAFTAVANDASAVTFNAAGIVQLEGTHFMAGVTLISPKASFRGVAPKVDEYKIEEKVFTPINFHFTQQLTDDLFIGLSVTNPYGLGTKWPTDFVGKYIAYDTEVVTFFFNPVLAYKISDQFSVSAGVQFAQGTVKIHRFASLSPFNADALVKLDGDGTAWGFTASALYKVSKEFSLGVSFKSEVTFNFKGDATSEVVSQGKALLPSGKISADLTTPMNLAVGAAYNVNKNLLLSADFQYVGWSSYDVLAVDFEDPAADDISATRAYENSYILRLGGQYTMSPSFALRGGILYDKNPVQDQYVEPTLPDADRLGFNIGFGYDITDNLTVDVAYLFLRFTERTITNSKVAYTNGDGMFNGTYNSSAHLLGLDFSYNF